MGKLNQVSGTGIDTFGTGNGLEFKIYPNPARRKVNPDINPRWGTIRYQPLTSNQQPGYRLLFLLFHNEFCSKPGKFKENAGKFKFIPK